MRKVLTYFVLLTPALTVGTPMVRGQEAPPPSKPAMPRPVPPVISSRQIDRYDAIGVLQQRVKQNPRSLADWIILGELAHEVAFDLPADQAYRYYRMSRDAYEKALAIQPDQPGLKAAIKFARDHETHSQAFEESRDRAVSTYLDARRRDLEAAQYTPSLPLYRTPGEPVTAMAPTAPPPSRVSGAPLDAVDRPAPPAAPVLPRSVVQVPERQAAAAITATDPDPVVTPGTSAHLSSANYGTKQFYSWPTPLYQAYYTQGAPYTYQQYSSNYAPAGVVNGAGVLPPITIQRYYQNPPYPSRTPAGVSPP